MKLRTIILLSSILARLTLNAQKPHVKNLPTHDDKLLHFGFNIGINTMDFAVANSGHENEKNHNEVLYADVYRLQPGFHVSIVSNLRLHEHFDLRFLPGIAFGQRNLYFINNDSRPDSIAEHKISSSFIEFPLLIKCKGSRINNFRPYVIGGGNVRVDLASKKGYDEGKNMYLRLKPFDIYYEAGVGFDSYLQYFKLSIELKYSIGLRDILVKDPGNLSKTQYMMAIDELKSRILMLSFYFE